MKCLQSYSTRLTQINKRMKLKEKGFLLVENQRSSHYLPVVLSIVLAAHKTNLITAHAHKRHSARMLANVRKDHVIPLL